MVYPVPGERYTHYKGGSYVVIALATHSETQEPLVVYRSLADRSVWARPLTMWSDKVGDISRFERQL